MSGPLPASGGGVNAAMPAKDTQQARPLSPRGVPAPPPSPPSSTSEAETVAMIHAEGEELGRLVRLYENEDREAGLRALVEAIERLNIEALQAQLFMAVATVAEIKAGRVTLPKPPQPEHVDV